MLGYQRHQAPPIAPLAPDQAHLFAPPKLRKKEVFPRGGSHRGCHGRHGQEESTRINEERSFAVLHLFAAIISPALGWTLSDNEIRADMNTTINVLNNLSLLP